MEGALSCGVSRKDRGEIFRDLHGSKWRDVSSPGVPNGDMANKGFHASGDQSGQLPQGFTPVVQAKAEEEHLPMHGSMRAWPFLPQDMRAFQMSPSSGEVQFRLRLPRGS